MKFQLAQVNIAKTLQPLDHPAMSDFVDNFDRINAIAESHEGFIWRYVEDNNNETSLRVFDDNMLIVNMSVWQSMDALLKFTYKSGHVELFKRRKEWFSAIEDMHMVCWYVPQNHQPSIEEAKKRLDFANENGESPYAFTFKKRFSVEDYLNSIA